jgi:hypothetical protein
MTVERLTITGGWAVTDVVNGYLVHRQYYGYNKRQAVREFREEMKPATTIGKD